MSNSMPCVQSDSTRHRIVCSPYVLSLYPTTVVFKVGSGPPWEVATLFRGGVSQKAWCSHLEICHWALLVMLPAKTSLSGGPGQTVILRRGSLAEMLNYH